MYSMLLTKNSGRIIGPIATLLGWVMDKIFELLSMIGLPNVGLAIIIMTILVNVLMLPLTYKQQKFSKLSAKMQPELQAIQAKYKNRKDNDSMMAMQQEQQAVYAKYGVSPTGSCVQLLIQMPILFALYRVFMNIPAYVSQVKDAFHPMVEKLANIPGSAEFLNNSENFSQSAMYAKQFSSEAFLAGDPAAVQNTFIDVLNKASTAEWANLAENFPTIADEINATAATMQQYNNLFGLNMGNTPSYMVQEALANGAYLMVIAALAIPLLSAVTQWINTKLMPQQETSANSENTMMQSMKTMNTIMPIMSAFFCYTMPAGMGLYWVAGSVVRSIQQIAINKYIDKMNIDAVISKNREKGAAKMAKYSAKQKKYAETQEKLNAYAAMNTKNVKSAAKKPVVTEAAKTVKTQEQKEEAMKKATEYYNKSAAKPGSMAAKANMVKDFNERNNKN